MKTIWFKAVVAGALSGLLFGFDTAVIAGVTGPIREIFDLTDAGVGAAVSAALWGTLVGAILAGAPGDRFGSRPVLMVIAWLYIVSAVGSAVSWNLESFFASRFVAGLAIGGSSVLAPVYLAEISPASRRGRIVGLFQLNIVLGILVAYLSNYGVTLLDLGAVEWRVKLALTGGPAILLAFILRGIPASPRWLIAKGRTAEAKEAAAILELDDVDLTDCKSEGTAGRSRLEWRRHRRPIFLALSIAVFNQLSGINAILYYSNDIFRGAGFSSSSAELQSIAIGVTNLIGTLAGLSLLDRIGRRPLLLVGACGTGLMLVGVGAVYATGSHPGLLLPMLLGFILFFGMSQGAVIWVYLSEVFPTAVRSRGQALGSATHWGLNALIALVFPILASASLALPFWLFAGATAVQFAVVLIWYPETRGRSLDEQALAG